jgi:hypothetical protein
MRRKPRSGLDGRRWWRFEYLLVVTLIVVFFIIVILALVVRRGRRHMIHDRWSIKRRTPCTRLLLSGLGDRSFLVVFGWRKSRKLLYSIIWRRLGIIGAIWINR